MSIQKAVKTMGLSKRSWRSALFLLCVVAAMGTSRPADAGAPPVVLFLDGDSIASDQAPTYFTSEDINASVAEVGLREQLPIFVGNVGQRLVLSGGTVSDEGWFALTEVPVGWATEEDVDGLENFVSAGPGLGSPDDTGERTAKLGAVPYVLPLHTTGLLALVGRRVCGVVYAGELPVGGDGVAVLAGATLGIVAFSVVDVRTVPIPGSLPEIEIDILDASDVCFEPLALIVNGSSS